ncbi:MAG: PadR family transcriptional regulator [Coleofasciculaceae cyanobacterium]
MFGTYPREYFGSRCEKRHRHPDFFASRREGMNSRKRYGRGQREGSWGDEQRTPRGEIKYLLLTLIAEQPQHGYQLIKELEARQGGFYRPSPGSVYPTLQLLEEGGYLISEQVEGKRVYTITDSGRELLAERDNAGGLRERVDTQQPLIELKDAVTDLKGAVMQVARGGNLEQVSRVREILKRAKREIYTILAED